MGSGNQQCKPKYVIDLLLHKNIKQNKLRGFSPQANYTDRAIAAGQQS
jgi:hypothetical protein